MILFVDIIFVMMIDRAEEASDAEGEKEMKNATVNYMDYEWEAILFIGNYSYFGVYFLNGT